MIRLPDDLIKRDPVLRRLDLFVVSLGNRHHLNEIYEAIRTAGRQYYNVDFDPNSTVKSYDKLFVATVREGERQGKSLDTFFAIVGLLL